MSSQLTLDVFDLFLTKMLKNNCREKNSNQDKYSKNGESQDLTESIIIDLCSDEEESSKVSHQGHLRTLCAKPDVFDDLHRDYPCTTKDSLPC